MAVAITYHALRRWRTVSRNSSKRKLYAALSEAREVQPRTRHRRRSEERHGDDRRYFLHGHLLLITNRDRSAIITVFRVTNARSRYQELDGSRVKRHRPKKSPVTARTPQTTRSWCNEHCE